MYLYTSILDAKEKFAIIINGCTLSVLTVILYWYVWFRNIYFSSTTDCFDSILYSFNNCLPSIICVLLLFNLLFVVCMHGHSLNHFFFSLMFSACPATECRYLTSSKDVKLSHLFYHYLYNNTHVNNTFSDMFTCCCWSHDIICHVSRFIIMQVLNH